MARVTIVPADRIVYVEGKSMEVDIDDLPDYIHAIQWDGSNGEIEFKPDRYGKRLPNVKISDFRPFDYLVQRWEARRDYVEERRRKAEEAAKAKAEAATQADAVRRSEQLT